MDKRVTIGVVLAAAVATGLASYARLSGQARPAASTVEAQLQVLMDKQAIHELFVNYGRTLDSRDFAGFEKLFARDAEYGGGNAMVKGPAAIRARLEDALKQNAAPNPGRDWHFFFNETIDVQGDDATAVSMGAFFVRGDNNKLESNSIATYYDHVVRENGVWRFKQRRLGSSAPATIPQPRPDR
jgi:SnoaL-like protein